MFAQAIGQSPWQGYERPGWTTVVNGLQLQQMEQALDQMRLVAFDYETSGLEWWREARPCGFGFAGALQGESAPRCWYVPFQHRTGQRQVAPDHARAMLQRQLSRQDREIVAHGAKFELQMSWIEKLEIHGKLHDTLPQAQLLDENRRLGLKQLMSSDLHDPDATIFENILDEEVEKLAVMNGVNKTTYRDARGYADIDIWLAGLYGCGDVWATWQLHQLYGRLGVRDYWAGVYETERELVRVLAEMQWVGVPVSATRLEKLAEYSAGRMEHATKSFAAITGATIELTKDAELIDVLQHRGATFTEKTEKGSIKVDFDVLSKLAKTFPEAQAALDFREAQKANSTYAHGLLNAMDRYGLVHCDFKADGARTGRMSAVGPNLQNQTIFPSVEVFDASLGAKVLRPHPLSVRYCFGVPRQPSPYWLSPPKTRPRRISSDYSQIELRTLAEGSQDPRMLHAFVNDLDLHSQTELAIWETDGPNRRLAKVVNFGLSFGMTPKGFARQTGVSVEQATSFFSIFFQKFPGMAAFRQNLWDFVRRNGGKFDNMFGRTRRLPDINSTDKWLRLAAERETIASFAQGSAADLMKKALVRTFKLYKSEGWNVRIVLAIHDDLHTDCEAEEMDMILPKLTHSMTDWRTPFRTVPVKVEHKWFEDSWDEVDLVKVKKKAS